MSKMSINMAVLYDSVKELQAILTLQIAFVNEIKGPKDIYL
jgi:hypothetical protein